MNDELTHVPEEIEIPTGPGNRLLVRVYENAARGRLVAIAPQYQDPSREWRLAHSGLLLTPSVARILAPTILAMAATIEDCVQDPEPTPESRCESRWP